MERSHVRTIVAIRRFGTTKIEPMPAVPATGLEGGSSTCQSLDNLESNGLLTAMIVDQRREVLERLAQGKLSPEEAEHHLAALDAQQPPARVAEEQADEAANPDTVPLYESVDSDGSDEAADSVPAGTTAGTVVAKLSGGGLIEVAGDESASEVGIEGPHECSVHATGDVVEVSGNVGDDTLLVYPAAAHLDVVANGSEAVVRGVRGTLRALFNVGEARVEGVLSDGDSAIVANVGVLDVAFQPDSDVLVTVRCVAHVDAGAGLRKVGRGEWSVGAGSGRLEISGHPGTISLRVD
jgi:hypothetical protein